MSLRKKLAAAALAVGIGLSGTLVTAPAANAYSLVDYRVSRMYYASPYCYASVWVDYNWWEESWAGGSHKDYRAFYVDSYGNRILYNCGNTPLGYILQPWSRG